MWTGVALVIAVLLVRRLPMVFALRGALRPIESVRDALFVGWFGPIGVAAVFYATLAVRHTGDRRVWVVASLIIRVHRRSRRDRDAVDAVVRARGPRRRE